MKLEQAVADLFEHSEALRVVRDRLASTMKGVDVLDRFQIACVVKEIDIVRVMLLGEYELLDTARIVDPEHLPAYHARRLEILEMTAAQLQIHSNEIASLSTELEEARVVHWKTTAVDLITSARTVIDRIITLLGREAMSERSDHTVH